MSDSRVVTCAVVLILNTNNLVAQGIESSRSMAHSSDTSFATAPWVWRNIGPARTGGYVIDIAVPVARTPEEPRTGAIMYAAGPGGLFKTVDGGLRWKPLLDRAASTAVSRVALAPSNPDIVWAATGNWLVNHDPQPGRGVFKSTDAGKHWEPAGLENSEYVGALKIHPGNPNIVYAGVIGPLTRPSRERGIYKTTDGGKHWTQVHFINEWTGIADIEIDPVNPNTIYATAWQQALTPRVHVDWGPGSGIYKSTDGGATWRKLTGGLPAEWLGRVEIEVSPASPNVLYAVLDIAGEARGPSERQNLRLYRSTDHGEHWETEEEQPYLGAAYYRHLLTADPQKPGGVFVWGIRESQDTGRTFLDNPGPVPGADHRVLWINPGNPSHLVLGNDHGIFISETRGQTWNHVESLTLARFWSLAADARPFFYRVYAVSQDMSALAGLSRVRTDFGITNDDWIGTMGGESGTIVSDPADTARAYIVDRQANRNLSFDLHTQDGLDLGPVPRIAEPAREGMDPRRTQFLVSAHDPTIAYLGTTRILKAKLRGATTQWQPISPDFVGRTPDSATVMGRFEANWSVITFFGTRLAEYQWQIQDAVIEALSESPLDPRVLYAGTRNGTLMVTRDGGKSWQRTAPRPGAPAGAPVSSVAASHFAAGTAYATTRALDHDDRRAHVFKTMDYGASWARISGNLPGGAVVWSFAEHFRTPGLLFVGTDDGIYASIDDGADWGKLRGNYPQAGRVRNLLVQRGANDLVASIWGRGAWILDDITPLEHWAAAVRSAAPYLFPVRDAMRFHTRAGWARRNGVDMQFAAPNPPYGALLTYRVPERSRGQRDTIDIVNSRGDVVRSFETDTAPGFHRFVWDLRWAVRGRHGPMGPEVRPGAYAVHFRRATAAADRRFMVVRDPVHRLSAAREDSIHADALRAHQIHTDIETFMAVARELITQLDSSQAILKARNDSAGMIAAFVSMRDTVAAILEVVSPSAAYRMRKVSDVLSWREDPPTPTVGGSWMASWHNEENLASGRTAPLSRAEREVMEDAMRITEEQRGRLRAFLDGPMAALMGQARAAGQSAAVDYETLLDRLDTPPAAAISPAPDYTEPIVNSWSAYLDPVNRPMPP